MAKEVLNVHSDLLPSDIFLRDVFDKNGPEALTDLINGYLHYGASRPAKISEFMTHI